MFDYFALLPSAMRRIPYQRSQHPAIPVPVHEGFLISANPKLVVGDDEARLTSLFEFQSGVVTRRQ